eukprot:7500191-Pyramimonas_sp.AAC.1
MESLGMLPKQLAWIIMPMLPKPQGGHRLIISYASAYRVWQRMRICEYDMLMKVLGRKYWGAGKGRSPIDSAWTLAARTEASTASYRFSATLIADYSKYYENI